MQSAKVINDKLLDQFRYQITVRDETLRSLAFNYSYTYALYFDFPDKQISAHWSHIRYQLLKIVILDISQLICERENDRFNFFKFLKRIETGDFRDFQIEKKKINFYRNELTKFKEMLNKILSLRDENVAHTEKLIGIRPNKSFSNVEGLINLLFEICNEFKQQVLNESVTNILPFINLNDLKKDVELSNNPNDNDVFINPSI